MARVAKRIKRLKEKVDPTKTYSLADACKLLVDTKSAKFDESVEIAINLGVDPKKADQNVRGSVSLPNGLGKKVRVAVFAKGEKAKEAETAGADVVGADDLVQKIQGGDLNFDSIIATPDMMAAVGKVAKVLGPRGLMPSPKLGTVTFDLAETVKSIKAGRAEFRVEKTGIVQASVGKASFGAEKIAENLNTMIQAIVRAKPATSKGTYLKSASVSLTMGPGIKVDLAPYRA